MLRSHVLTGALAVVVSLGACAGQAPTRAVAPPERAARAEADAQLRARRAWVDRWGDEFTRRLFGGSLEQIFAAFTPPMKKALPLAKLELFRRGLSAQLGHEGKLLRKAHTVLPGVTIYRRVVHFSKAKDPFEISWTFSGGPGRPTIAGFHVRPPRKPAASTRLDYQTKARMRLPFDGTWFVAWGGRTLAQNYHARAADQRFALDVYIVKQSKTHRGAGKRNEDYFCFGRPLLAAASGQVVAIDNEQPDNVPGVIKSAKPLGNHVIIDQGDGEFAFYCHLKRGSLRVKAGDVVKAGQPLGACGNSGHTSEPHLHFHLQDTPTPLRGRGIPAQFQSYRADGRDVARGEPTQGQLISPR